MNPKSSSNPFLSSAIHSVNEIERKIEAEKKMRCADAVVDACEAIMRNAVQARVILAAEAVRMWGAMAEAGDPFKTQTFTGVWHIRVKFTIHLNERCSSIQFIGAPKSGIIGIEGESDFRRRRWKPIALTADAISTHIDRVLHEFLTWSK